MRLIKIIIATGLVVASASSFAGGCQVLGMQVGNTYNGKTTCSGAVINDLVVNGPLMLQATKVSRNAIVRGPVQANGWVVTGNLLVAGPLQAQSLKVGGRLTVQGPARLQMAHLTHVLVKGPVQFSDVTISGSLDYMATIGILNHSTVPAVVVRSSRNELAVLCLGNKTQVNGDVTFTNGGGTVYASGGSIVKGGVVGGQVTQGACPGS
jgi:hypothetical protein